MSAHRRFHNVVVLWSLLGFTATCLEVSLGRAAPIELRRGNSIEFLIPKTYKLPPPPPVTAAPTQTTTINCSNRSEAIVQPPYAVQQGLPSRFPKGVLAAYILWAFVSMGIIYYAMLKGMQREEKANRGAAERDSEPTERISSAHSSRSALVHFDSSAGFLGSFKSGSDLGEPSTPGNDDPAQNSRKSVRYGHKVHWFQYFALGFWLVLMTAQAAFTRLVCHFGVPRDCEEHTTLVAFVQANHMLMGYGVILGMFTGVTAPTRFLYIFSFEYPKPRGLAFIALFFLASPVWGCLDLVPALSRFSIHKGTNWDLGNLVLLWIVCGLIIWLGIWHFIHAWKYNPSEGFMAYTASRIVMFCLCLGYFLGSQELSTASLHVHHYLIGFFFAVLAEFNHPLSLVLLAIASGVMVQGIAAYGADPFIIHH